MKGDGNSRPVNVDPVHSEMSTRHGVVVQCDSNVL